MRRTNLALFLAFLLLSALRPALADTVSLAPTKDATLYERDAGATASGAGSSLIAGVNGFGEAYRTVLAFDIAGSVPGGATIDSVELRLHLSHSGPGAPAVGVSLHGLTTDWGEGASDAGGPGSAGTGDSPVAPDTTWIHTFFPGSFWATPGGDFVGGPSATTIVPGDCSFGIGVDCGIHSWASATMATDVQAWLDSPSGSFGWVLKTDDEVTKFTALLFDSRTGAVPPELVVDYTPSAAVPMMQGRVLVMLGLGLLVMVSLLVARRVRT